MNNYNIYNEKPWLKNYPNHLNWSDTLNTSAIYNGLQKSVELYPDRCSMIFMDKKWTYKETDKLVNKCASGLQKIGISKGDRVAIALPNTPYYIFFFHACTLLGAIVVNLNPLHTIKDMNDQVNLTKPKIIITINIKNIYKKISEISERPCIEHLILCPLQNILPLTKRILFNIFNTYRSNKKNHKNKLIQFNALINNQGLFKEVKINHKKDLAVLQFTGGTTGELKAAKLTHANLSVNINQMIAWNNTKISGNENVLCILPFFHIFGLTVSMLAPINEGSTLIIMPKFDVKESLHNIEKYRVTYLPGVPTIFGALKDSPNINKYDLTSIKLCFSGGAPLPSETKDIFEEKTGCKIIEGYGLSETSPVVTVGPIYGLHKKRSAGLPVQNTEIKIRPLDGLNKTYYNENIGEICIKGPQLMEGYWEKEKNNTTFYNDFFRSGDIGYFDKDGYLFLIDRIKDIIITNGYNIYPGKIEAAIYEHPSISEVVVIGIKDEHRGETPKAYIKLNNNKLLNKTDLISFLSDKLSPLETPKYIEFRKEIPKTIVGKLSKEALRNENDLMEM